MTIIIDFIITVGKALR